MAGYLWRERRRRLRKIVGTFVVAVAAALVVSWWCMPSWLKPSRLLVGIRPPATQPSTGTTVSNSQPKQEPALRPVLPPPLVRPAGRATASQPAPAPAGTSLRPTIPTTQAVRAKPHTPGLVPKVISPVTQPAAELPSGPQAATKLLADGLDLRKQNKLIEARSSLNLALHSNHLTAAEVRVAREALADIANKTIFNKSATPNDPLVEWHLVVSGDTVGRIAKKARIAETLLAQINGLRNPNFLREGARIKIVQGPFHAAICKSTHELHLYLQNVYVGTLLVALGQNGTTPTGQWRVENHLENPIWQDPRTGKRYHPDDPTNPLGEYWIGLEGLAGEALGQSGYGIHGTIEPETIGQDVSMGCVRLTAEDITMVYRMLEPGFSYVVIHD